MRLDVTEKDIATALATTVTALLVALSKQGVVDGEIALADTLTGIGAVHRGAASRSAAGTILEELIARLSGA